MDGIKDLKNLALKAIEKRSSLLKNEKYILWKIKKNWTQIVNGPIGEKTYPKSLFNGNLVVVINDGIIYHTTIMYAENIKEKINTFLNGNFLESIEFVKVNYKIKRDLLDELIENEEKRGTLCFLRKKLKKFTRILIKLIKSMKILPEGWKKLR